MPRPYLLVRCKGCWGDLVIDEETAGSDKRREEIRECGYCSVNFLRMALHGYNKAMTGNFEQFRDAIPGSSADMHTVTRGFNSLMMETIDP